jgi:hypothetical protein
VNCEKTLNPAGFLSRLKYAHNSSLLKHVSIPTEQARSNCAVEERASLERLWQWQPARGSKHEGQKNENGSVELRNDLDMGSEA